MPVKLVKDLTKGIVDLNRVHCMYYDCVILHKPTTVKSHILSPQLRTVYINAQKNINWLLAQTL